MTTETRQIGYTGIFERNQTSRKKVIINVGGARSSKSHSVAQLLITKCLTERNKSIGICRKTFPSLRMTALKMFLDLLKDYGLYEVENHNRSFNTYSLNGNLIQFFGLDEAEKIKSAEFNYIWMEEANEFTYTDYVTLKTRLSGKTSDDEINHMYLTLNPIDANNWIPTRAAHEEDVEVIKSNFMDNPYLDDSYKKVLTDLINQDENFYRIYALGEWGMVQRRIYTNFTVVPALPQMKNAHWAYGLDFGQVNPSCIIRAINHDDKFYIEECLYESGLTNSDLIEAFSHLERGDIYGDPSAKMMITEIRRAGYSAHEGHKGVKESIDLCQRQTLYVPESSTNLIKELQSYQWRADKDGNILSEPIKYNDHAVDAMRYAVWGITERFGFATQRPRSTEPIKSLSFGKLGNNKVLDRWLRGNNGSKEE